MISIRAARQDDFQTFARLLEEAHLPLDGVKEHYSTFLVAEDDGILVGGIGLELYGEIGLLRSAVVGEDLRNKGVGSLLYQSLLSLARVKNVKKLLLLTTTAEKYFERKGFRRIDRSAVSGEVVNSVEFASACPKSAVCMQFIL